MSGIKRIIFHWAVTKYKTTELARKHYHAVVEGDGKIIDGIFPVEANISPKKGAYAAHTLNCNTGSAAISAAAMFGAKSVTDYGQFPITEKQFNAMCYRAAEWCIKYKIPVTNKTVLSHAEVQKNLGIKQRGKWDIAVLPFANLKTAEECGWLIRKTVQKYIDQIQKPVSLQSIVEKPIPVVPAKPKVTPTQVAVGTTVAVGVVASATWWDKISNWFGSFF